MKEIDGSVFEALFRQAIIDDYNEEIDSIPPEEDLVETISFSPEFELRMKKLFAHERRKEFLKKAFNYGRRAAAVFVVAVTILFCMLLFNPEVRAAVKNTVVEWYDKFTSFIFQEENSDIDEKKEWQPEYLPAGYRKNSVEKLGRATNIEYTNDLGGAIYFSYRPDGNDTNISADNENHVFENDTIDGHEAYIIKATKDGFENGLIWNLDGYTFNIWSELPIKELIKIAKSIYWQ